MSSARGAELVAGAVTAERRAGLLLHPTSLPGPGPCGTLGAEAYRLVDFIAEAGLGLWQMLPLGPTDASLSPYHSRSTRAGDTRLIDRAMLVAQGWLQEGSGSASLASARHGFARAAGREERESYETFRAAHADWLDDYALFVALKERFGDASWWHWPAPLRDRQPDALAEMRGEAGARVEQCRFEQFVFELQWRALRRHAHRRGVRLFGDMPIFVSADSADVWAQRHYFKLDAMGRPAVVTGVPPDAFAADGQRWGSLHYDWERMCADGFEWWRRRTRFELSRFDLLRVDHFRGFAAAWEIPAEAETARVGAWAPGPGEALFRALAADIAPLPIVAEDLGLITPDVHALRERFAIPGMRVLQFAFDGGADNPYLPHNHSIDSVVYTGTHDNDTSAGWFAALPEARRRYVCEYLGARPAELPWALVRAAFASVGALAVVPLQDLLGLDASHRMNTPGVAEGNWRWRFEWSQVPTRLAGDVARLVSLYGR